MDWMEAARLTAVERMPAVSQVSTGPAGWGGEEAGEAGGGSPHLRGERRGTRRFAWKGEDVHGGGVGADGCGVDPGFGFADGVVVEEVAGFEVVGAVQSRMRWAGARRSWMLAGVRSAMTASTVNGGVEEEDFIAGGFGFGEVGAGVGLVEEDLALEVGGLDEVAVDEGEVAYAGSGKEGG